MERERKGRDDIEIMIIRKKERKEGRKEGRKEEINKEREKTERSTKGNYDKEKTRKKR